MAEREREKEVVEVGRSWDETAKKETHMYHHPSLI
jgi:hypothetical protein